MIFGDYDTSFKMESADLYLSFSDLEMEWDHAAKLADYISDYYSKDVLSCTDEQYREIINNISYVANELLENSLKFNESKRLTTAVTIDKINNCITIVTTNHMHRDKMEQFTDYIKYLLISDPELMLMERIEKNIDDVSSSGLGYITLMLNYEARLGFKFAPLFEQKDMVKVYTMAKMPMLSTK